MEIGYRTQLVGLQQHAEEETAEVSNIGGHQAVVSRGRVPPCAHTGSMDQTCGKGMDPGAGCETLTMLWQVGKLGHVGQIRREETVSGVA